MTPNQAKKVIKDRLEQLQLPFTKLTARTVDFTDLARATCVFVKIHGWQPSEQFDVLDKLAKANGFRVETDGAFG